MHLYSLSSPTNFLIGVGLCFSLSGLISVSVSSTKFNTPGNLLITDQFNNRVIEIDPSTGDIVWHWGNGLGDISAAAAVGTNDAERVGSKTLIAGTGIPPGGTPNCRQGCADNRVFLVEKGGQIIWQYGSFGVIGSGPNQLNTPVAVLWLPSGNVLITDQGNQRVIEVKTIDNSIVWQYGTTGVSGNGVNQLNSPNSAELLSNGNILIADEGNDRAIEVTHTSPSTIVSTFTAHGSVSGCAFASRLMNGNTLLTSANNALIVEVDPLDNPVWQFITNTRTGSNLLPAPTRGVRLSNGNTLISDQFNNQVIVVNPDGTIVEQYGTINHAGFNPFNALTKLNAPYSAYAIADYTGMTNPGV